MTNPIKLKHKTRILMMQALYRTHFLEHDTASLIAHSVEGVDLNKIDYPYFQECMIKLIENISEIDNKLIPYLDRPLDQLNPVELAVLRVAVFELLYRLEIPYKVVINEAVEITKKYGSVQGYKFVNGVLDKMSSTLRKNG